MVDLPALPAGPSPLANQAPPLAPGADPAQSAKDFEAFFLTYTVETMQAGLSAEPPFGGGQGETAFRSFLNAAYADAIVAAGGTGLAAVIEAQLTAQGQSTPGERA